MDELLSKINNVIAEDIKPLLKEHDGDIALLSFESGIAKVKFLGACRGCPGAQMTITDLVEAKLQAKVPEVKQVILVDEISPDMIALAKEILGSSNKH